MRDRLGHAILIGQRRIDRERNPAVRPTELRARNYDARGNAAHHLGAHLLGHLRHFLGGAEHDVALEHRKTVELDVLDRLGGESVAAD